MIGASLTAAETAKPKKRYFTAPDGTKYEWTKKGNPTQADIDAIVNYHNTTVAPTKKAVKEGGQNVVDTLTGMFGPPPKQEYTGFGSDVSRDPDRPMAGTDAIIAALQGNPVPSVKGILKGQELANKAATESVAPILGPIGEFIGVATGIPGTEKIGREMLPSLAGATLAGDVMADVAVLGHPKATAEQRLRAAANIAIQSGVAEAALLKVAGKGIKAVKNVLKGAEKAAPLEKAVFTPKDLEGYTSPSNLKEAGVTLKTGENPAVAAKKAELDARRAARTQPVPTEPKPVSEPSVTAPKATPKENKRVYHGTLSEFNDFDPSFHNTRTKGPQGSRDAFFFSHTRDSAEAYAYDLQTNRFGRVIEAELDYKNPMRLEKSPTADDIKKAKSLGHDAIETPYEVAVFSKSQIKQVSSSSSVPRDLTPTPKENVKQPTPNTPKPVEAPQKPVQAPETASVKEPWQMTRKDASQYLKDAIADAESHAAKKVSDLGIEQWTTKYDSMEKDLRGKLSKLSDRMYKNSGLGPDYSRMVKEKKQLEDKLAEVLSGKKLADADNATHRAASAQATIERMNELIPGSARVSDNSLYGWGGTDRFSEYGLTHRDSVIAALKEGKPVPKEVLADYPDLAAKYAKPVESKLSTVNSEIEAVKARRDARLKSTTTKGTKQRGSADFTKDDFNDALELAELYVKKVGYTFEQYAKEMVDYFGDGVKPHLKEIWDTHAPKAPEMPRVSVPKPKTGEATGVANQVLDRESAKGLINEVEKGTGKNAEHWQKEGQKAVQAGQDPVTLARRIANGEEDPTPLKFGILQEGKAILQRRLNNAAPGEEFDKALKEMDEYLADVQSGKGIWSDMGRALQAGTELDTGNFAQVIERVQKQGGKLNPKMEQQFRDMTEKVKAAESKLAETERLLKEEQAKRTTASQAKKSPRFSKEDLDIELDQLLKEFGQKASKLSAGIDPELLPVMGKIAVNYMKRGVNTLDEVVAAVQSHFKDATYEDVVSGIDAAAKGTTRTRSELQKEIARLKSQAKSDVKVRQQIKSLQEQLRTGDYDVPTKRESTITKRVEDLRLERDLLSNEVKARVGSTQPKTGWQTVTNALNAPKSIKSSIDISAAGRQGWFLGAANPDKIPMAFADQLKAMASPKGALKAQNAILERPNAPKYKRMGLYIAPLEGHGEEAFKGTVFPRWSKLNPFQGSSRAYTAYLNRMRVDVADRLIKWAGPNATDDDLKVIGNFINTASGRGGKSIHLEGKIAESLNNVFFSPRFVASRFELALGQPLMTAQGKLGKSLKARSLVAQQYAATLGTIGSIVALAKHMNPDMNTTDPTKPDYMSPKIGDTKIDVLAGLRQTVNLGAKLLDRDRNEFQKGADVGRFIRSKASPAAGSAYSLYTGKDYVGQPYGIKDALTDLVSPLSVQELVEGAKKDGWNQDDFLGLLNFLGFNTQTYKPKEDKKDRPN